jgi:hypothetical protein
MLRAPSDEVGEGADEMHKVLLTMLCRCGQRTNGHPTF